MATVQPGSTADRIVSSLALIAGVGLFEAGLAMLSVPAALICGGVLLAGPVVLGMLAGPRQGPHGSAK
jgi:hypothetical protein